MAEHKKFRVSFIPASGAKEFTKDGFATFQEARAALNLIAEYTLDLHHQSLMADYVDLGYIEHKNGDDWFEVDEGDFE